MINLYKSMKRRLTSRPLNMNDALQGSLPPLEPSESFRSNCLHVLENTTPGTAIYILSCLCPENMDVIRELIHLDLSQPHQHPFLSKKRVHDRSSSYEDVISELRAYGNFLPQEVYGRLWLEVAHHWLLSCPLDSEYPILDENGDDMFCRSLRSELIDRILKID